MKPGRGTAGSVGTPRAAERLELDGPGEFPTEDLNNGLAPAQGPGEIGRLGPFQVVKLLGSGGMGSVYQGIDGNLGRPVALKVMQPQFAGSAVAREWFLREARAVAARARPCGGDLRGW